jgi:uncharacterized protein (DUF302 family)
MMVMGSLDQASALSMTGLRLPGAETFFVGNPATGKMFFQADPAAGAVLPVRMYAWVNSAGKTEVGYIDPGPLLSAMSPKLASGAGKLTQMAAMITRAATGSAPAATVTARTTFVATGSGSSFSATVASLKHAVAGSGMMVLGSLNQASALSMTGLTLPGAQSLFVGNPATGKMFFQADPAAGMAVPVGMYVWQGSSGTTEIGYYNPGPLFAAISPKLASGGQQLSMMAAKIAKASA